MGPRTRDSWAGARGALGGSSGPPNVKYIIYNIFDAGPHTWENIYIIYKYFYRVSSDG